MDEMFYAMHISNSNYYMHISCRIRGTKRNLSYYMMIGFMEDSQVSYIHEEDIRGMHVNMGNVEIDSNGRRDRQDPVIMRSMHREVQSYKDDNERIMKDQENTLQSLNIFHKKVKKDSGTKK